ncbi:MAG: hypothetical protein COA79_24410 [Planctomycetota bacterium]|nr:MAG: hypothetical protein COA79_24410 [Planctomycetota bacterium]
MNKINLDDIDQSAKTVLEGLHENGYDAYIVGGAVRDLLLGRKPKDFDIVTNATNSQIAGIFEECELIGRRFPIALIHFKGHYVEVSTFASEFSDQELNEKELRVKGRDRIPGTIEEDSARRDFTINALFYDIKNGNILDFENGLSDLKDGLLKMIGDPELKTKEDPVRILRGYRQLFQMNLTLDEETSKAFENNSQAVDSCSVSRLREEINKIFKSTVCHLIFPKLISLGIFEKSLPEFFKFMENEFSIDSKFNLLAVLIKVDDLILKYKKIREPILYISLLLPYLSREFSDLWIKRPEYQEMRLFNEKISEMWIELSVKKWVKRKITDMLWSQSRLLQVKEKMPRALVVYKEYFLDSFRFLRFKSELEGIYEAEVIFWSTIRHYSHIIKPVWESYSKGEVLTKDEILFFNKKLKSHKKSKPSYYKKNKKKSH